MKGREGEDEEKDAGESERNVPAEAETKNSQPAGSSHEVGFDNMASHRMSAKDSILSQAEEQQHSAKDPSRSSRMTNNSRR